jgi:hypothetical protein
LVNILILRLCNYEKSPDHVESAGKFTLNDQPEIQTMSAETDTGTYRICNLGQQNKTFQNSTLTFFFFFGAEFE